MSDKTMEDWVKQLPPGLSLRKAVDQLYLKTLEDCHGVRMHAAQTLGVSIRCFRERLKAMERRGIKIDQQEPMNHLRYPRPSWLPPRQKPPKWEF